MNSIELIVFSENEIKIILEALMKKMNILIKKEENSLSDTEKRSINESISILNHLIEIFNFVDNVVYLNLFEKQVLTSSLNVLLELKEKQEDKKIILEILEKIGAAKLW